MRKQQQHKSNNASMQQRVAPLPSWKLAGLGNSGAGLIVTRRLGLPSVTTSAAGTFSIDSGAGNVGSASDWSAFAASYASYRLIEVRTYFLAISSVSGLQTEGYLLAGAYRNSSVPASTPAAIWVAENPKLLNPDITTHKPLSYAVRATGAGDCDWVSTVGPASQPTGNFGFKVYNGSNVSVVFFTEMLLQFRSST